MNVRLVSIENDGIVRLAANGAMTASEMAGDDKHPLAGVIGESWSSNRVVLGLNETEYVDSTAIGWLLSCQKQFNNDGGKFALHSIPPSVQQIFDLLKVDRVLNLAKDENEALQIVRGE
ncbi:MAG: STAS domain-containing protein [Phycisphaeraceae bacterium]